ncbi:sulfatase-like hydrolase/transferase [Mucilaginibacter antarcticus]|uniref:sulfatase-like hydrolase/transferase n=1 Tax=Mucilaginibacter antarcticus TaxID=1855725 RepID=UPI003643CA7A
MIMADDMGFSDVGAYGGEIPTPNIDGIAKSGIRFTQFYNTSRCCPTRASLLTGLYSHQAGVGQMAEDPLATRPTIRSIGAHRLTRGF